MEKANKRGYGWGASLQVVYCLLMLAAVLPTSTAQTCPAGCSGCGTTTVDCDNAGLTSFPQLPSDVQQSVQTLFVSNNMIKYLEPNVLDNFANLRELYLTGNMLMSVPENLFGATTELRELYLPDNQLTSLPDGLFNATPHLHILYLHTNQLMSLPDGLFSATTRLQRLWLSHNQLMSLPEDLLSTTTQLQDLRIDSNQLTSLPENLITSLSTMTQLFYLFISSNPWNCDCELHGLPDILRSVTYTGIPTCATPANLSGAAMSSLTEDHLVCECTPACVNGTCNRAMGACECSDGYTGQDCSTVKVDQDPTTSCRMKYPVQTIDPSPATGNTARCPSEQEQRTEGGSSSTVILGATITVGVILLLLLASAMALAFVAVARRRRRRRQPEDARELPEAQFELDDN